MPPEPSAVTSGAAAAAVQEPGGRPAVSAGARRVVLVLAAAAALFGFLVVAGGARPEPATYALVVAGGALILCLRTLYRLVIALARPDVRAVLDRADLAAEAGRRELRDEKKRILRAIKELDFDRAMGKISQADYDRVRQGYRLRAVDVMRALDEAPALHPDLLRDLDARHGSGSGPASPVAVAPQAHAPPAASSRTCGACEGTNDPDAKFCKHCGKELAA